jgi:hypothetical protein
VLVEPPFPVDVEFGFPVAWASNSAPAMTSTVIHALSLGCRVVVLCPLVPASGPAMLCTQITGVAIVQLSLQVTVLLSVSWSIMAVDPICVSVNPGPISQSADWSVGAGQLR